MRRHSAEEAVLLEMENTGKVFLDEHGLALAMTRYVLERTQPETTATMNWRPLRQNANVGRCNS